MINRAVEQINFTRISTIKRCELAISIAIDANANQWVLNTEDTSPSMVTWIDN